MFNLLFNKKFNCLSGLENTLSYIGDCKADGYNRHKEKAVADLRKDIVYMAYTLPCVQDKNSLRYQGKTDDSPEQDGRLAFIPDAAEQETDSRRPEKP